MSDTGSWFTIFRVIFECTSAYSLIGLSLGMPNDNFSFSGEFTIMSKIVVSPSCRALFDSTDHPGHAQGMALRVASRN